MTTNSARREHFEKDSARDWLKKHEPEVWLEIKKQAAKKYPYVYEKSRQKNLGAKP